MDVITAFLNGAIIEDIFMETPKGFEGHGDPTKVVKLNKALYGLKQIPKVWYDRIDSWLVSQGLTKSDSDSNMYFSINALGKYTVILLHVNDLLITSDDILNIQQIQHALVRDFDMTDLRIASQYLGAEFSYHTSGIWIHQRAYIDRLLERFNMIDCHGAQIPMDPGCVLHKETGMELVDPEFYWLLVGSLIYITNTRLDISYRISLVSKFMDKPQHTHLQAARQILRYLKETRNFGLHFSSSGCEFLHFFSDIDWGRDVGTRRSTTGILHKLGDSCIDWTSKLQSTVSMSTIEAEYRTLAEAAKDIVYLRNHLSEFKLNTLQPTTILSDNQSCLKIAQNPVFHARTNISKSNIILFEKRSNREKYM
jgi:hypothetical protein